ncbi:hypothetical protein ACWGR4_30560 [Embleya sp. NPDC055664]
MKAVQPHLVITAFCGPAPVPAPEPGRAVEFLHLPIRDLDTPPWGGCEQVGSAHLESLIEALGRLPDRPRVLTMCLAGLSRSCAVALVSAEFVAQGAALTLWRRLAATPVPFAPNPDLLRLGADLLPGSGALARVLAETQDRPRSANARSAGSVRIEL